MSDAYWDAWTPADAEALKQEMADRPAFVPTGAQADRLDYWDAHIDVFGEAQAETSEFKALVYEGWTVGLCPRCGQAVEDHALGAECKVPRAQTAADD